MHNTEADFRRRAQELLAFIVDAPRPTFDLSRRLMHYAIAKLGCGAQIHQAIEDIAWVNSHPGHEVMFFWHANIDAFWRFGHLYPDNLRHQVRQGMTAHRYAITHGQTENHKIMTAVAGYLAAQAWPEWEAANDVMASTLEYLESFFMRVACCGQGEFDSPTYSVLYLNSLATLYDFAHDPDMRRKAEMMLHWFVANMAGEWLNGRFAGAHSRDYTTTCGPEVATGGLAVGWLYFGGHRPDLATGEPHYAVINALSAYRPPAILIQIAQDRTAAYEHRETHDLMLVGQPTHDGNETCRITERVQGFGYISRIGVRKYTYMTPTFAMGSLFDGKQGDVIWAGQMRRWSLVWDSDYPASTLFFTHPFPDSDRPDDSYREQWRGSSPYEQVLQYKGALIAVYNVPRGEIYKYAPRPSVPSDRDPHIEGFFSCEAILLLEEHPSGWLFCHAGAVLIAVRPLRPYRWTELQTTQSSLYAVAPHRRLLSDGRKNGVIVEATDVRRFAMEDETALLAEERRKLELRRFRETVLSQTTVTARLDDEYPSVAYTSLNGDYLHITYNGPRLVNGRTVHYDKWPLIANPFLHSEVGSGILEIRYGAQTLKLDFHRWEMGSEEEDGLHSTRMAIRAKADVR